MESNQIKKLLPFLDEEIVEFVPFIISYMKENAHKYSVMEAFTLGAVGTELQYNVRILKRRLLLGDSHVDISAHDILVNNKWITLFNGYEGLADYLVVEYLNTLSDAKQYELQKSKKYDIPWSFTLKQKDIKAIHRQFDMSLKKGFVDLGKLLETHSLYNNIEFKHIMN